MRATALLLVAGCAGVPLPTSAPVAPSHGACIGAVNWAPVADAVLVAARAADDAYRAVLGPAPLDSVTRSLVTRDLDAADAALGAARTSLGGSDACAMHVAMAGALGATARLAGTLSAAGLAQPPAVLSVLGGLVVVAAPGCPPVDGGF